MAYKLDQKMVIGISSRALFDLTIENEIFEKQGLEAYCRYQVEHESEPLKPGPGFRLVQSLLKLNEHKGTGSSDEETKAEDMVEVIVMSRNSPDTSLRVFNSIKHYKLPITRAVLVSGASLAPYLNAFQTDLFLSAYEDDVQCAIDSGIAAGIICTEHNVVPFQSKDLTAGSIRIAFDGDAVVFSDESEQIYKAEGLHVFGENEEENARKPLAEGACGHCLKTHGD